ncbi:TetR/AcrR family transcriptional regulator [Pseudoclavibacter helvolus]|uniref:TetR/AcrR family transcriptional regulator n=1 Tax=Pseudoclavibacter helvolus TaxID=255205 RepID=UPI003C726E51
MKPATAQRGRPRSEASRQAILAATRDLLLEGDYDSLTMLEIAKQAGVGRQTVYRWWGSKAAVVADCVVEGLVAFPLKTPAATGDPDEDLRVWLELSHERLASPSTAPLVRALTAAATTDADATEKMAELFTPVRESMRSSLAAAIDTGAIRAGTDPDAVVDLLVGSLIYAVVSRDASARDRLQAALDVVLTGIRAERA